MQQVCDAGDGPSSRLFHKRIEGANIRPRRGKIRLAAIFGDIVNAPLSPALAAIDQFKSPAAPRMERMRDREKLFCMVCIGCSSRPTPKAKANANISSGRDDSPPTAPASRSLKSKAPIRTSTTCDSSATPTKSIANCARPRNGHGIRPRKKNAQAGVQRRGALGGILCGGCASSSKWAAMAAWPSARNAGGSKNLPPPKSCLVFTLQALTPSWRLRPIPNKNPCCPSPIGPNEPSCFANSKTFLF